MSHRANWWVRPGTPGTQARGPPPDMPATSRPACAIERTGRLRPVATNWRTPVDVGGREPAALAEGGSEAAVSAASTGEPPWRWNAGPKGPAVPRPLQAPGAAGALDGEQQGYLTAYTTRLVTSVVCRGSIPARGDIAIRQPAPGGFSPGAVASLLRCVARRPIRIQLRRAGRNRRVPARILT
ncbi:hypothetical protein N7482_010784 [Penicillium canariense]|uniref:Uncharacterized protein n=1 Tax=Penicillium canariense TaxID=189055 RepID=A0A9W9HL98_9EURO|nr:hypothetical protein N7482_010784 [Penicillium canariense]